MYTIEGEKYFVAVHRNRNLTHFKVAKKQKDGYKYIGQVGTGVTEETLQKVFQAKRSKSIFSPLPMVNRRTAFRTPINNPKIVWIKPELNCQVKYLELDRFGIMRHPSFKSLL